MFQCGEIQVKEYITIRKKWYRGKNQLDCIELLDSPIRPKADTNKHHNPAYTHVNNCDMIFMNKLQMIWITEDWRHQEIQILNQEQNIYMRISPFEQQHSREHTNPRGTKINRLIYLCVHQCVFPPKWKVLGYSSYTY